MSNSQYYGTGDAFDPPPGMSRQTYRRRWKRGEVPGVQLPGRGGVVVTRADWAEWLRSQQQTAPTPAPAEDPIEAAVRSRFKCAS